MAPSIKIWHNLPEFFLCRFPFINAISLLMLLAERAESERQPPLPAKLIYMHIFAFLLCGFLLSGKMKRKEAALIYTGQLFYFAYNMYFNTELRYSMWQRSRMAVRHLGCGGVFVVYSFLLDPKRPIPIRKMGEIIVGLYLLGYCYVINTSPEDKRAFLSHIIGGDWSRYFFILILASAALCFFSGYFIRDISLSVIVCLIISTVYIDADITYWVDTKGMHFWNQMRILCDDVCLILGFGLFYTKFCNRIKMKDD